MKTRSRTGQEKMAVVFIFPLSMLMCYQRYLHMKFFGWEWVEYEYNIVNDIWEKIVVDSDGVGFYSSLMYVGDGSSYEVNQLRVNRRTN